ncbi:MULTISPECIES: hypothetical protein [Streptococcus]|uniref:hypothetical protein n=1 Tax=Streptococcus TaxID=1301 RepID=UPI0015647B33|nr:MULTISPECIES: hypothetical protein [unclassified Streptococcus]UJD17836.1 hypothetical protein MissB1_0011 [Streptococcus phage MissB1]
MAREGIYVGGKEITQRYVGDKLVWEKRKTIVPYLGFMGTVSHNYYSSEMNIFNYSDAFRDISFPKVAYIGRSERLIAITLRAGYGNSHVIAKLKSPGDFNEAQRLFDTRNADIYMTFYEER